MISIVGLVTGFIFLFQTIIILVCMCVKKRANRYFYRKWINERNERNERNEQDLEFYV